MAALKKIALLSLSATLLALGGEAFAAAPSAPRQQGAQKLEEGFYLGFLWPLRGETSSIYGSRTDPISTDIVRHHSGLDIAAPGGTQVVASKAGRVTFAGTGGDYGTFVTIQHAKDMETRYGHLGSLRVKKGTFVRPGQVIGTVGNTGRSTGYHLHFEIRSRGRSVDPVKWLVPHGYMMPGRATQKTDKRR